MATIAALSVLNCKEGYNFPMFLRAIDFKLCCKAELAETPPAMADFFYF
jgi:hypothetical protein